MTMYDGVAIQNMLGTWYAAIFPNTMASFLIRLDELQGYRIIDAKFMDKILVVIGEKNGKYDRFILAADSMFSKFSLFNKEANIATKV